MIYRSNSNHPNDRNHYTDTSSSNSCTGSYRRRVKDTTTTMYVDTAIATTTSNEQHQHHSYPQHYNDNNNNINITSSNTTSTSSTCTATTTTTSKKLKTNISDKVLPRKTTATTTTTTKWQRLPLSPVSLSLVVWIWNTTTYTSATATTDSNNSNSKNSTIKVKSTTSKSKSSNYPIKKLSYITTMAIITAIMGCTIFTSYQMQLLYSIYVYSSSHYHDDNDDQSYYNDLLLYNYNNNNGNGNSRMYHATTSTTTTTTHNKHLPSLLSHSLQYDHSIQRQLMGDSVQSTTTSGNSQRITTYRSNSMSRSSSSNNRNSNVLYNLPIVTTTTTTTTNELSNTNIDPHKYQQQQERICTSPESNVPWIFGDHLSTPVDMTYSSTTTTSTSSLHHPRIVQSQTSQHRCGFSSIENNDGNISKKTKKKKSFVQYLQKLSQEIKLLKQEECTNLLVYGVAFGDTYVHWLVRDKVDDPIRETQYKMSPEYVNTLLQLHGQCFITFVVQESLYDLNVTQQSVQQDNSNTTVPSRFRYYSNDGLQLLIPISKKDLPYKNMRRNTKIFKMLGPSYIFDWVERVVWQDAKLIAAHTSKPILPNNYYEYFFNTIDFISSSTSSTNGNSGGSSNVCASFMGIPFHRNTMGTQAFQKLTSVQFAPHCNAIIEASIRRPTISDDLSSVLNQCSIYQNITSQAIIMQEQQKVLHQMDSSSLSNTIPNRQLHVERNSGSDTSTTASSSSSTTANVLLDQGMIDSAFIVWDLRTERCQNFVATISCTWFDEIHCYSDRDQISFPYVFWKMGLQEMIQPTSSKVLQNSYNTSQLEHVMGMPSPETHHRLFAHYSTPSQPLVHITKSTCHWYFNNLNACDFQRNDPLPILQKKNRWPKLLRPPKFLRKFLGYDPRLYSDNPGYVLPKQSTTPNAYKIAIIVVGSFHRYIFQSSIQRLIQPLTAQGNYVDYYVSMSMKKAPAYRADQGYMNHLVNDPIFDHLMLHSDDINAANNDTSATTSGVDEETIKARIKKVVEQQIQVAGGHLRFVSFQENIDVNQNVQIKQRRKLAKELHPNEDPDLRFPILDLRDTARNRTANANRNMLNLFFNIQQAYQRMVDRENEIRVKYDYVFFLRDDTMWLENFDFRSMLESTISDVYNNDNKINNNYGNHGIRNPKTTATVLEDSNDIMQRNIELYVPSCDARIPSMHPAEINDHIAIVKRNQADVFGMYFDELFRTDYNDCASRLDDKIRFGRVFDSKSKDKMSASPVRGCNSEMILQYILETRNVTVAKVGQGNIPFQRMALVAKQQSDTRAARKVHACFHKFCQSYHNPLTIPNGLKNCKDLTITSR